MKIPNLFHSLIFYTKSSILDVLQGIITEYASGQKAVNYVNFFNIVLSFTCFLTFLMTSEAYSEPIRTSKMALSVKIAKGFKHYYFWKKLHLRCLTGFWIGLWINYISEWVLVLELEYENYYYYSCKWSQLCQFISMNKHKKKGLLHEIELKILLLLKLEICADFSNSSNNFLIYCWSVIEKQRKVSFYMLFWFKLLSFYSV